MADTVVNPLILKDCLVTIDAVEYQGSVSKVVFTPSGGVSTWKGLTPSAVHTAAQTPTWTADLSGIQDWDTEGSLAMRLFEGEGETVDMTFAPVLGGGTWAASVILTSGAIGGAVDEWGEQDVSLGMNGRPTFTPAAG